MLIALSCVIILLAIVLIFKHQQKRFKNLDKSVAVLDWWFPLVGHLPLLYYHINESLDFLYERAKNHKGAFYFDLPFASPQFLIAVFDPQSTKHMLTDNFENYVIPSWRKQLGTKVFGRGIFQADGDLWKLQRDLAKPMFTSAARRNMIDIFKRDAKALVDILQDHRRSQTVVDMQTLFKRLTLDTFGEIGLGVHLNVLNKPAIFSEDFDWILSELEVRFINPIRPWTEYQFNKRLDRMDKYITEIINERKNMPLEGKRDLLSLLLQPQQDNKFIRDSVINFIIAGRDTTAVLLSWTIYYLTNHPDVLEKVCAEIHQVLGPNEPTYDNIKGLQYVTNVFNEVLRLRPPALPVSAKEAVNNDILPNGIKITAGQTVMFSPYVLHRLYWGNDAELFKPERWDTPIPKEMLYTYIPFQRGPRQCLGMSMAYEEATIVLTILLQNNINFKMEPGQHLITSHLGLPIIFGCRNGLNVKIV